MENVLKVLLIPGPNKNIYEKHFYPSLISGGKTGPNLSLLIFIQDFTLRVGS
jgi:hypothetical protein